MEMSLPTKGTSPDTLRTPPSDTNVFILGAGFSKAAGVPLLPEFMSSMRDAFELADNVSEEGLAALDKVLMQRALFSRVREKVNIDLDNIEQLFGVIDAQHPHGYNALTDQEKAIRKGIAATVLASFGQKQPIVNCQMLRILAKRLLEDGLISTETDRPGAPLNQSVKIDIDPYLLFALLISRKYETFDTSTESSMEDVVITFNYDLVIEKALNAIGAEVDYQLSPICMPDPMPKQGSVPVLKLHGSINWELENESGEISITEPESLIDEQDRYPFMVPPTWNKARAFQSLNSVWHRALYALNRARRIFIIGYSIPASDVYFEHFLAAGLLNNHSLRSLVIVNPARDYMKKRLGSLLDSTYFERRLKFAAGPLRKGTFEDLMSWFDNSAKLMNRCREYTRR